VVERANLAAGKRLEEFVLQVLKYMYNQFIAVDHFAGFTFAML
jgi:hypothetical protein